MYTFWKQRVAGLSSSDSATSNWSDRRETTAACRPSGRLRSSEKRNSWARKRGDRRLMSMQPWDGGGKQLFQIKLLKENAGRAHDTTLCDFGSRSSFLSTESALTTSAFSPVKSDSNSRFLSPVVVLEPVHYQPCQRYHSLVSRAEVASRLVQNGL